MVYGNKNINHQGKRQGARQRARGKRNTLAMHGLRDKANRLEEDIADRNDPRDSREVKNDSDKNVVFDKPLKVVVPRTVVVLPLKGSRFSAPHPSTAGVVTVSHSKFMKDTAVTWPHFKGRVATELLSDNSPLAKKRVAGRLATANFRDELITILRDYLHLNPVVERSAGNLSSKARGAFADSLKSNVRDQYPNGCIFALDAGYGPKGRYVIVVFPYWYVKIPYTMEALSQWNVYFASQRVDVLRLKCERELPLSSPGLEVPIGIFQMLPSSQITGSFPPGVLPSSGLSSPDIRDPVHVARPLVPPLPPPLPCDVERPSGLRRAPRSRTHDVSASVEAPPVGASVGIDVRLDGGPSVGRSPTLVADLPLPLPLTPDSVGSSTTPLVNLGNHLSGFDVASPGSMKLVLDWLTDNWEGVLVVLSDLHAFSLVSPSNRASYVFNRIARFLLTKRKDLPSLAAIQSYLLQLCAFDGVFDVLSWCATATTPTSDVPVATPHGFMDSFSMLANLSSTVMSPGTALHACVALAGSVYAISHLKTEGVCATGVFTALFRQLGFIPRTDTSPNDAIAKALIYIPVIFAGVLTAVRLSSFRPLLNSGRTDNFVRIVDIIAAHELYVCGQVPNSSFQTREEFENRLFAVVSDCERDCKSGDANVMRVWSKLSSIHLSVLNNIRGSPRCAPYVLCLFAGTAAGKTSLLNTLLHLVAREADDRTVATNQVFVVNSNDKFLSGAHMGITDIILDDVANAKAAPGTTISDPASHLIMFNNNIMTPATMASVEEKGRVFLSPKMVYVTTNVKTINAELHSNAPISILRRMDLVLTVVPKAEYCLEGTQMLDPSKIPDPELVPVPDLWNFKAETARFYAGQGSHVWVDLGFPINGTIFDLVKFIAVRVKTHRASQASFVKHQIDRSFMKFTLDELSVKSQPYVPPVVAFSGASVSAVGGPNAGSVPTLVVLPPAPPLPPSVFPYAQIMMFSGASVSAVGGPNAVPPIVPPCDDEVLPVNPFLPLAMPVVGLHSSAYPSRELIPSTTNTPVAGVVQTPRTRFATGCHILSTMCRRTFSSFCDGAVSSFTYFLWLVPVLQVACYRKSVLFYIAVCYFFGPLCCLLCLCEPFFANCYPLIRVWYASRQIVPIKVKRFDVGVASLVALMIYWLTKRFAPTAKALGIVEFIAPREAVVVIPLSRGTDKRKTTTLPQYHAMMQKRVLFARFTCGTERSVGVLTPLCTNLYLVNAHVLTPLFTSDSPGVITVEFCRARGASQVFGFRKSSVYYPPGKNDIAFVHILGPLEGDIRGDFISHDTLCSLVAGNARLPLSDSSICLLRLPEALKRDMSSVIGSFTPLKVQCIGPCISMQVSFGAVGVITVLSLGVTIPTVAGDCGSPLTVATRVGGTDQVLLAGIFCGQAECRGVSRGIFAPVTKELVAQACLTLLPATTPLSVSYIMPATPIGFSVHSSSVHPLLDPPSNVDKMLPIGVLKNEAGFNPSSQNTFRSEIVRSAGYNNDVFDEILGPKQHTFLTSTTSIEPFNIAIGKICDRIIPESTPALQSAVADSKISLAGCKVGSPKVLSIYAAINGTATISALNMSTAAGIGFAGKKSKYFVEACMELNCSCSSYHPDSNDERCPGRTTNYYPVPELLTVINDLIPRIRAGETKLAVFRAALKDDVTPNGKQKVRIFFVGQVALTIISRMYYAPLFASVSVSDASECAIGMDVHSQDWENMEIILDRYSSVERLGGDYSSFDLSIPSLLTESAFQVLAHIASLSDWSSADLSFMNSMSSNFAHPVYIMLGQLYQVSGTMASGMSVTTQVNSLMNGLVVRGAFYTANPVLMPLANAPTSTGESQFQRCVRIITYGDDVKGAVKPVEGVTPLSNFHIRDFAASMGMTFGPVDKGAGELPAYYSKEEITFLKCEDVFVPELQRRMGSLCLASVRKCLAFERTHTFEARLSTANAALRLFFPFAAKNRDHATFDRLREEIIRVTHGAVAGGSADFDPRVIGEAIPCYTDMLESLREGASDTAGQVHVTGELLWSLM